MAELLTTPLRGDTRYGVLFDYRLPSEYYYFLFLQVHTKISNVFRKGVDNASPLGPQLLSTAQRQVDHLPDSCSFQILTSTASVIDRELCILAFSVKLAGKIRP
jgi:hypothetical protein